MENNNSFLIYRKLNKTSSLIGSQLTSSVAGSGNKGDLLGSKLTGNGSPLFEVDIVQPPVVDPVSISECSVEWRRERERVWFIGISAAGIYNI